MALFRRSRSTEVEVRAPTAATQALRWVNAGRPQAPDWNATQAFRIANNTVLTCIDHIATHLSGCPFRVGADPDKPEDFDPKAPLARLLGKYGRPNPDPDSTSVGLWKWSIGQHQLAGRFAWEIELSPTGIPVALWPLPASSLKPIPSASGAQYFSGYVYGRPADEKRLPPERVVHHQTPGADDWRQPDPPLRRAYLDTLIAIMQTQYDHAFLKNDGRPAAIIVTEEFADEEDKRAFEQQWNATYGGATNAGKVAVVEADGANGVQGAIDVKVLGISQKDAQAAQRYEQRITEIVKAFKVPMSVMDASGRTYDNASQEWQNFCRGTLEPLAGEFAAAINAQLAPQFGPNVGWFDLSRLYGETRKSIDPAGAVALFSAGIITKDEAREPFGYKAVDGGDAFAPPATFTAEPEIRKLHQYVGDGGPCLECTKPPVHQAHGYFVPQQFAAPQGVREAPAIGPPVDPVEPPAPLPEDRGETAEEAEERRAKIYDKVASSFRALEQAFTEDMARLFRRQAKSVLARLEHKRARRQASEVRALADEVFDPEHWLAETISEARILYRNIALAAGGAMADRFGIAFDLDAPFVQEFIAERANQLAGQVTTTTYEAVKDALAAGVSEGEAIPQLAARVQHVFDVASSSRATMIARTETISAFNGAGQRVADSYGTDVVAGQEWISTHDNRVRIEHAERDGEVVQIGEPFSGGLAYPGDPAGSAADTINCRCTVAYLTPEEMSSRSARAVPLPIARAVMALIRPGPFDERGFRAALRLAA